MNRSNRLGVKGWVWAGRFGVERYLYTLHRVTGIGLVIYLFLHIYETGIRLQGREAWEATMALFRTPFFVFLEYVLFVGFIFHAVNGLRLIFTELGYALGKPTRPVYPYRTSVLRHRPVVYVIMILMAILIVLGGVDIFLLPG
ncbi:MAG: succinate dehydrogenase, cytochrome b556 subunit [Armatimonadota bacterium]|nr:succinate dehydrogenase, cytochrome b556 subunit [Armatimonadota bacterium]MDR5702319.1 succinate dehydrogenase, cytochrome b556 subunit [Armatimonadota bacterium]